MAYIEAKAWEVFGAPKAFRGEPMLGRTSSSEAQNAYDQAMLTAIEKARYIANQLLTFVAETDEDMWRQFADPDLVVALTRDGQMREIKPAELYGNLRYKISVIDEFENSAMARRRW